VEWLALDAASSVREARQRTAAVLAGWRCHRERIEDAVLVVSEVVTNAVQHGAGAVVLRLFRRRRYIRVEVQDNSPRPPVLLAITDIAAERGRGLRIVRTLAARWGSKRVGAGKLVWAELPAGVDFGVDEVADRSQADRAPRG
jgi:anti-sigma regulatory factor (Ser/Thr protein kinase)